MLDIFNRRPLISRAAVFVGVCVLYSGLIGPRIIASRVFEQYWFTVYGGLGKALLFGALAFALLAWRHKRQVRLTTRSWGQGAGMVLSAASFVGAWLLFSRLEVSGSWLMALAVHGLLWLSVLLAAVGVFGLTNLRRLVALYARPLLVATAIAAGFLLFLYAVYALWQPLSFSVMHAVKFLLGLVGVQATIVPPLTLLFDKFGITIAQYCSGIESIALFSGLYVLVGLLDWPRLRHGRFVAAFVPGLALLFVCNILRVFVLILAGYYINQHIAFSLFHTYAGMVFFIIYSGIFWAVTYKWMLKKSP